MSNEITQSYLSSHKIRKLHIGCSDHILDGWLNTDISPQFPFVLRLDASQPFPLGNDEFDYIFSEHMIEHILYPQGMQMLSECYRVLRKNGRVRISTPNLNFLIDLYKEEKTDLQKNYIKWATDQFIRSAPWYDELFVINNFVRDWGHKFIYNEKILAASLRKVGFSKILRCELNKSEEEALRNLENENRMPAGFLKLETMTLEGVK